MQQVTHHVPIHRRSRVRHWLQPSVRLIGSDACEPEPSRYLGRVNIDRIRELNDAVPFLPYEIHRSDGKIAYVAHPDFIAFSPQGSYVHVINPDNRSETIYVSHIVALHHVTPEEAES